FFLYFYYFSFFFFFSSRRRHTRFSRDWSSDVCSSDLLLHYTYMKIYQPPLLYLLALALIVTSTSCQSHRIMQLHEDSGWCWFQDNRAIIDGDQLIFSGV